MSSRGISSNTIQISTTSNFSTVTRFTTGGATFTNWTVNPGLATTNYFWRVLTFRSNTVTWYTSTFAWVFVDTNNPNPIVLTQPVNNSIFSNTSTNFKWNIGTDIGVGVTNYILKISNINTSWWTNITTSGLSSDVSNLQEGTNYWYVSAVDKVGNVTPWASPLIFTVDRTGPNPPALVSPTNNWITNTPKAVFIWKSTNDIYGIVASYEIQISTNNFANTWNTYIAVGTSSNISGLNLGTNWWRVRAIDSVGNLGQWSSTNKFYIRGTLAWFTISHQVYYEIDKWGQGPLIITAIATNGNSTPSVFDEYTGSITITVTTNGMANGTAIDWTNLSGTVSSFTQYADGSADYIFSLVDAGVLSLNIRSSNYGVVSVYVHDGNKTEKSNPGPLYFESFNPYIVSIEPHNQYGYATVSELKPFTITFSRVIMATGANSLQSNIWFRDCGIVSLTFSNVIYADRARTVAYVETALTEDDFLKDFYLIISRNIKGTNGYYLTNSIVNSDYSFYPSGVYPNGVYIETFLTLVDKTIGGTVSFDDARGSLVIGKNVLPDDAYIKHGNPDPSDDKLIADANSKLRGSQFIGVIENDDTYVEITANDRNNEDFGNLNNKAQLYISYQDNDNNGIVDGTDIQESKLKLFRLNEATGEWEVIFNSEVDTVNNKVYADIDKFGTYCIMAYYETDSVISYPNPANVNDYDVIIRFNLERDAKVTIKIYTITGELVRNLTKDEILIAGLDRRIHWDGKNDLGLMVVNGVYLIRINKEGMDNSNKEVIILKQGIIK